MVVSKKKPVPDHAGRNTDEEEEEEEEGGGGVK